MRNQGELVADGTGFAGKSPLPPFSKGGTDFAPDMRAEGRLRSFSAPSGPLHSAVCRSAVADHSLAFPSSFSWP